LNYYSTFGGDKSALLVDFVKMHLYGGFFDVTTGFLNRVLGNEMTEGTDYIAVRHAFNAILGSIAILFSGLFARVLGGWQAGLMGLFMMFFAPRFFGHSLMNPRDIPFAAGYAVSLYFISLLMVKLPRVRAKDVVGLTLGIGLALAVRSGGLLLIAYLGMFLLLHFLYKYWLKGEKDNAGLVKKYGGTFAVASAGGLIFSLVFWPFGLVDPLNNIPASLSSFSNYHANIRLLFDGSLVWSQDLPLILYIGKWFLYTVPLLILAGLVLFAAQIKTALRELPIFPLGLALFTFIFPILYILYKESTLYDGLRHLLFSYVPLVTLCASGWSMLSDRFAKRASLSKYVPIAAFGLLLLLPAQFMVRNTSLSYTYFNELRGGMKGNLGMMEQDYWGVSVEEAARWLEKEKLRDIPEGKEVRVGTNFGYTTRTYLGDNEKVKTFYSRFRDRYDKDWDYAIYVGRFIDGTQLRSGKWPSTRAIHSVTVNGVPVAVVYQNLDKIPSRAQRALKANNWSEAISMFEQEVSNHPDNDIAWRGLGTAYLNTGDLDKAENAFKKCLEINEGDSQALNYLGIISANKNEIGLARNWFEKSLEYNPANYLANYYLAQIAFQSNDLIGAQNYAEEALKYNPNYRDAYLLLADIYERQGDKSRANQIRNQIK
jgi:tetratricopeptide (TPR) repeat protein